MSEPTDPNQPYVPQAYPRMLYAPGDQSIVVSDPAEEAEARSRGFSDEAQAEEGDGLEIRTLEELVDIALRLQRNILARMDRADLIAGIRERREAEAERLAAETATGLEANEAAAADAGNDAAAAPPTADEFDRMDKAALRAFIKARDRKHAPGFFNEEKLRHLARNPPPAA